MFIIGCVFTIWQYVSSSLQPWTQTNLIMSFILHALIEWVNHYILSESVCAHTHTHTHTRVIIYIIGVSVRCKICIFVVEMHLQSIQRCLYISLSHSKTIDVLAAYLWDGRSRVTLSNYCVQVHYCSYYEDVQ